MFLFFFTLIIDSTSHYNSSRDHNSSRYELFETALFSIQYIFHLTMYIIVYFQLYRNDNNHNNYYNDYYDHDDYE